MTPLSRLIANILLPLLFFCCGYVLLYRLGEGLLEETLLQSIAIGLSALLAILPPLAFGSIIRSQVKEGFALLKNGNIVTLGEITITDVLGEQITAWKLFQQQLKTEACLQGEKELVYVQLVLDFHIPNNQSGKEFVKNYKNNMIFFDAWIQRTIFLASIQNRELAHSLASGAMMNEEDERVLRRKFLSALKSQPLNGIELPTDISGISVNRQVRVKQQTSEEPPI